MTANNDAIHSDNEKKFKILNNTRQKCGCFFYLEKSSDLCEPDDKNSIPQINLVIKKHNCDEHDKTSQNDAANL